MDTRNDTDSRAEKFVADFLYSKTEEGRPCRPAESSALKGGNLDEPFQHQNQYDSVTNSLSPIQANVATAAHLSHRPKVASLPCDDKRQHGVSPNTANNIAAGGTSATLPQQYQSKRDIREESAADMRRTNSDPVLAQGENRMKSWPTWRTSPKESKRRLPQFITAPLQSLRGFFGVE